MKKILSGILLIILLPGFAISQCNNSLIDLCLKDNGGAKSLKEFPVRLKTVKKKDPDPYARFTVALKRGVQYRFNIKNDSLNIADAKLTLSDDYKLLGTTFDEINNINDNYFDFYCKNSGNYYLTMQFMDKEGGCAVGMISFVDNFNVYSSK
ncbi:hypothetical protein ACFLQ9_01595 [Bacteroidota bacterium]